MKKKGLIVYYVIYVILGYTFVIRRIYLSNHLDHYVDTKGSKLKDKIKHECSLKGDCFFCLRVWENLRDGECKDVTIPFDSVQKNLWSFFVCLYFDLWLNQY